MTDQLVLELADDQACRYGLRPAGAPPACTQPATHAACWELDGDSGRIACCLAHANYYAEAWCSWWYAPASRAVAWLEVIP